MNIPEPEEMSVTMSPCERAGVHVAVHTHAASVAFSFMDEMQEFAIQATNQKGTSLYSKNLTIVDNNELMAWVGLLVIVGLDKDSLRPVDELFSTKTGQPIYCTSKSIFLNI